ncbi:MAG: Spo0B domain-containing protein [Clostridia bacterium]|nr:Spo0B domain-containing protein [Clostridia bacterium]
MKKLSSRLVNMNKAAGYTIGINAIQILGALTVTAFSLFSGGHAFMGLWEQMLLSAMTVIVCWGAALDIKEAVNARKIYGEADMLEDAYGKLEQLNTTLRAQRHDFMNHLQVVYSLLELEEYQSAEEYIERVYGDIKRVGRSLKTAHPAVNALLAAKLADCESRGIKMELEIESPWETLPVPGWEICRVLGNLIDNGMDALSGTPDARMTVSLGETLQAFTFEIANNGPQIPDTLMERIFQSGFSTKSTGRGMGLAIVRTILQAYGGKIELRSDEEKTAFTGTIAKPTAVKPR